MVRFPKTIQFVFTVCLAAFAVGCGGSAKEEQPVEKTEPGVEVVTLKTSLGDITLGFLPEKAPGHVENFKKLSREGFYDGTKFHRVIPGFMIQGGDPLTKGDDWRLYGTGDPGYKIDAEFNDTVHTRGIVSMARGGDPNSAGSQFFICHAAAPHLNGGYTAFGFVISGLDTVDKIANVETRPDASSNKTLPIEPVIVESAVISELPAEQVVPEQEEAEQAE